jgi:hypothetical protein
MTTTDRDGQAPWQDVQLEAAAQFSALCMQIGAGRYPWQDAEQANRPQQDDEQMFAPASSAVHAPVQVQRQTHTAFAYDLLVV